MNRFRQPFFLQPTGWAGALLFGLALAGCEPTPPKPVAAQRAAPAWPTAAAAATAVPSPATLAGLRPLVGSYPGERTDYLREGALAVRLQRLMGGDYAVLLANLGTSGPLVQDGSVLYITGNKPHEGGDEQAAVVVDTAQNALRVWLVHGGREQELRDPPALQVDWPADVLTLQANRRALQPRS